jgi:hypothetical protein
VTSPAAKISKVVSVIAAPRAAAVLRQRLSDLSREY